MASVTPRKNPTPTTTLRIPLDLKAAVKTKADAKGETLTDVVLRALERYVKRP